MFAHEYVVHLGGRFDASAYEGLRANPLQKGLCVFRASHVRGDPPPDLAALNLEQFSADRRLLSPPIKAAAIKPSRSLLWISHHQEILNPRQVVLALDPIF